MANPSQNNSKRGRWIAAALVTALVMGLCGWLWFHGGALCGDEVNVFNLAKTHSVSQMTRDSFPILLPLLLGGWQAISFGNNDFSLRALGLVVGLCLTGALWLPAWIGRRQPPLLSLMLFGLSGSAIYWTAYLRGYGVGTLLIVLTIAAMCFLLKRPTWQRTGILAAAAVLSVQALYQNAVFFAAIGFGGWAICWLRKDKATAIKIAVTALAGVVSLVPYLKPLLKWQQGTTIRPGFSFRAAINNLQTILAFPLPQYVWLWALLVAAVVTLAVAAMIPPTKTPAGASNEGGSLTSRERRLFAGTVVALSVGGYWLFLHLAGLITSPWYFLPLMGVAAVCFDLAICLECLPGWLRTVAYGISVGTVVVSVPFGVRDLNCRFSNMDLVTSYLAKEESPQDYVLVTPWYLGISFSHYFHGTAAWDSLPPVADHSTYRFDLVPQSAAGLARASQPVLDHMKHTLKEGHRVWVVGWMRVPKGHHTGATPEAKYLEEHSESFVSVDLKIKGQTSDYENVSLLEADGWKPDSPQMAQ